MDFAFSEEQQDLEGLARQILDAEVTHERLKEIEAGEDNFDRELWAKLADAGVLGIALPEAQGGGGYGFLEAAIVLEQVGRTVAPIPYLSTVVDGALPIARFGSDALKRALLPGVAAGTTLLTAALVEAGGDPRQPGTTAHRDGLGRLAFLVIDCLEPDRLGRLARAEPYQAAVGQGRVVRAIGGARAGDHR